MNKMQTVDVLRTQGIMAKGYGIIPQIIARDDRLTPEAKSIYCYFSSFAGAGFEPVFPSRDLMLKELAMSKDRYYRHLKILVDCNYITIERCKIGNLYSKNIYTLVQLPNAEEPVIEGKEAVHVKRPAKISKRLGEKKAPDGEAAPAAEVIVPEKTAGEPAAAAGKYIATAGSSLRIQLGIDSLIEKRPESKSLILDILMVIEDMAMSEQVTINGSVKKKAAIRHLLGNLRLIHIETMVNNISCSGQKIWNKKAYIQSCVGNALFNSEPLDFSKQPSKQDVEDTEDDRGLAEAYARYPELKDLDRRIQEISLNISKAILSGNEIKTKTLRAEKEQLEMERERIVPSMNATS